MVNSIKNKQHILDLLCVIRDPEIPVVSIYEIGMLKDVVVDDGKVEIHITPTYNSCPAMEIIVQDIRFILKENQIENFEIVVDYSPAWTTDNLSEETRNKLKAFGIAPPQANTCSIDGKDNIQCPRCDSVNTSLISHFGSTLCKALYKCNQCKEVFDYFKCH